MGETIHHSERDADIIPFRQRAEFLDELGDREVIDHFLTELVHPSALNRLAAQIPEYSGARLRDGRSSSDLSEERIHWRERMQAICDEARDDPEVDVLTEELGKTILEQDADEVVNRLVTLLQDTKSREKDLADERYALRALLEVREASVRRGMHDDDRWGVIINRLMKDKL